MTTKNDSTVRRALATIRRAYADMDRISRAMATVDPSQTRR